MATAWKRSPRRLISRLEKIRRSVPLEATGSIKRVIAGVKSKIKDRVHPARTLNRQDSPSGKRQQVASGQPYDVVHTPDAAGVTIRLSLSGYYTGARTEAVQKIFASIGKKSLLVRKTLLVYLGNRGGKKKFRSDVKGRGGREVRLRLSGHGRLQIWAERKMKGEQIRRHVVRLPKEALRRLVMVNTVKTSIPELLSAWQEGIKKGFL